MHKIIILAILFLLTKVSYTQNNSMRLMNVITADSLSQKITSIFNNGNLLILGKSDGTIELWDSAGTKRIKSIKGHNREVTAVTCDSYQTYFASASKDTTLKIWNIESDDAVYVFKDDMLSDSISNLVFNRKLGIIISVSKSNIICTWNTNGFISLSVGVPTHRKHMVGEDTNH